MFETIRVPSGLKTTEKPWSNEDLKYLMVDQLELISKKKYEDLLEEKKELRKYLEELLKKFDRHLSERPTDSTVYHLADYVSFELQQLEFEMEGRLVTPHVSNYWH